MSAGMGQLRWGLALIVLGVGSLAQAEPPPVLPPIGDAPPAALPPKPIPVATPATPPSPTVGSSLPPGTPAGEAKRESDFTESLKEHAHHEEEEETHSAFIINGEYLLWRPVRVNQDYAVSGAAPFGPVGDVKTVDGGYDSGFRVYAAYRFADEGWEVGFGYTYLQTIGNAFASAPANGFLFPTLTYPGALVSQTMGAAAADSINLNVYDLELGKRFQSSETLGFRVFVGAPRFADVDQKFAVNYVGGDVNADNVRRQTTFNGFGFRTGGEANYKVFDHLSLYARGSASMMTGSFNTTLFETANGQTVVNVSEKFQQIVPVVDMGLGVSYQFKGLRLSVGYEFVNWFGMDEQLNFGDDQTPGKLLRRTADLGFEGLVFRAEFVF